MKFQKEVCKLAKEINLHDELHSHELQNHSLQQAPCQKLNALLLNNYCTVFTITLNAGMHTRLHIVFANCGWTPSWHPVMFHKCLIGERAGDLAGQHAASKGMLGCSCGVGTSVIVLKCPLNIVHERQQDGSITIDVIHENDGVTTFYSPSLGVYCEAINGTRNSKLVTLERAYIFYHKVYSKSQNLDILARIS